MARRTGISSFPHSYLKTTTDSPQPRRVSLMLTRRAAERALKPVAIGRKNFLFAGKDEGAENLAKLQTIVATCQKHGVNPQAYLHSAAPAA